MLLPSVLPSGSALVLIWHKLYPHDVRHCASQSQSYWWVSRNISFLGLIQTKQPSQQFRTSKRIIFSRSVSVCLKAVHFGSVNNKIDYVCLVSASLPLFILNRDMGPQLKKAQDRKNHSFMLQTLTACQTWWASSGSRTRRCWGRGWGPGARPRQTLSRTSTRPGPGEAWATPGTCPSSRMTGCLFMRWNITGQHQNISHPVPVQWTHSLIIATIQQLRCWLNMDDWCSMSRPQAQCLLCRRGGGQGGHGQPRSGSDAHILLAITGQVRDSDWLTASLLSVLVRSSQ